MSKYWLYLEPYTFIFHNEKEVALYNSINGAYLLYSFDNHLLKRIVNELEKPESGYGVLLEDREIEQMPSFIKDIRGTFSGDCILIKDEASCPFIFKPMCRIMEQKLQRHDTIEKDILESYGTEILGSLNEVTLYFGKGKENGVSNKYPYCKQFAHSLCYDGDSVLQLADYRFLIEQLQDIGIGKLNIVLNDMESDFIYQLRDLLMGCSFSVYVYCNYEDIEVDKMSVFKETLPFTYFINIHKVNNVSALQKDISRMKDFNILWNAIVTSETELLAVQQLEGAVNIVPYYNGNNEDFFKEYVYNDLESILEYPIDKQTIFRRQTINENFFGKLFILPDGEVHANMNCASLGNIKELSLSEIVYKEMTQSSAWFKLRDKGKCRNCINKYLCPSISDYELTLQKYDLCHIVL